MKNTPNPVEEKLERLEELLHEWKKESEAANEGAEKKIRQMTIRIICIIFAVLGSVWSVVEFGDWYLQRRAIAKLAENYLQIAEENFQKTGDVATAFRMTEKAMELDSENPEIQYRHVYFKSQQLRQKLQQITRPLNADEISQLNETFAEIDVLKKQEKNAGAVYALEAELLFQQQQYDLANVAIGKAIACAEQPMPEWLITQLQIAVAEMDFAAAEKIRQRIDGLFPDTPWPAFAQGIVAQSRQDFRTAQQCFDKVVKSFPRFVDGWQCLATVSYSILPRDLATVRRAAKQVIALRPGACAGAYEMLTKAYLAENKNEIALAFAENGMTFFPDYLALRQFKINALLAAKRYDEALAENFEIRKLMPDNLNAAYTECKIYEEMGNFTSMYRSVLQLADLADRADNPGRVKNNVAWYLFLLGKDYERALRYVEESIQRKPRASALDTKAWLLLRLKRYPELDQTMTKCLELAVDPGHRGKMLALQAQMLIEKGDLDAAQKKIGESEKLYPDNPQLYVSRSMLATTSRDWVLAQTQITEGLKLASSDRVKASLHWAAAQLYWKQQKYESALPELEIVAQNINTGYLEIQPFFMVYADVLHQLKRDDDAVSMAQKVLQYAPENAVLRSLMQDMAKERAK